MSSATLAISHPVIVDNFIDATGFPGLDSNFFKYEYGPWKNPGDPVGSEYPRYPNWNFTTSDAGYLKEFHFTGIGADIYGAVYCIDANNNRSPLPYTASIDGKDMPYPDAVKTHAGYPLVYTVSSLSDANHVVKFKNLSVSSCGSDSSGVIMPVDYALIRLDDKTKISKDTDLLLASYDDEFIQYSGSDWAPGTIVQDGLSHGLDDGSYLSMTAMETTTAGASVSFTFFGSYAAAAGTMNVGKDSSVDAWKTQVSLQVTLDGKTTQHQYPEPNTDPRPFFWEASDLTALPDGAPHVVNITLLSSPEPSQNKFRVAGFAYRPTFGSLEEGNGMVKKWVANGGSIVKTQSQSASSTAGDSGSSSSGAAASKSTDGTQAGSSPTQDPSHVDDSKTGGAAARTQPFLSIVLLLSISLLGLVAL